MRGRCRRLKRLLFYGAVRVCVAIARLLPRRAALALFSEIGALWGRVDRPAFRRSLEHLEIAFGSTEGPRARRRLARAMCRDLGRNVVDLLRMERLSRETLRSLVEFEGLERLDDALARGRGVLAVSAHLGNWELLGAALCARGYELHVLARPLFDAHSDRLLTRWRRATGIVVHRPEEGLLGMARVLRAGAIAGVLLDQDTRGAGVFAELFHRPAHTPTAPFRLARRLGAAVVPIVIGLDRDGVHRARVLAEIPRSPELDDDRQVLSDVIAWHRVLEQAIERRPTQWAWFHRRWRRKPVVSVVPASTAVARARRMLEIAPSRPAPISR